MAIPFPDILEHNNPNNPLMDVNQLGGITNILNLVDRDTIPLAKRKLAHQVNCYESQGSFIYIGTDVSDVNWVNVNNWKVGGEVLASNVSVIPTAEFTSTDQQSFNGEVEGDIVNLRADNNTLLGLINEAESNITDHENWLGSIDTVLDQHDASISKLDSNQTPAAIADTDNVRFKSATGYYNRTLSAIKNYILTGLSATNVALTPALWFVSTNVQAFAGEIAGRVLSDTTAEKTTLIDADSVGIWDSASSLFKRTTLLTISNFFSTKYFSDVWDLSLDNGNILVKGHITQAGTFAIKVRYKFYQNVSDVSVKLFPSTIVGGNWVRFEIADYCRNSNRVGTSVLAFTITNFYSVGNNFIGTNFSNIAGSGSVTENQQDDNNTYLESTPRALYSNIDFIVDHTNASVSEEAWGIVHLTGTIL